MTLAHEWRALLGHLRCGLKGLEQDRGDLPCSIQDGDTKENTNHDISEGLEPPWSSHIEIIVFVNQANIGQCTLHRLRAWLVVETEWIKGSGHDTHCNVTGHNIAPKLRIGLSATPCQPPHATAVVGPRYRLL